MKKTENVSMDYPVLIANALLSVAGMDMAFFQSIEKWCLWSIASFKINDDKLLVDKNQKEKVDENQKEKVQQLAKLKKDYDHERKVHAQQIANETRLKGAVIAMQQRKEDLGIRKNELSRSMEALNSRASVLDSTLETLAGYQKGIEKDLETATKHLSSLEDQCHQLTQKQNELSSGLLRKKENKPEENFNSILKKINKQGLGSLFSHEPVINSKLGEIEAYENEIGRLKMLEKEARGDIKTLKEKENECNSLINAHQKIRDLEAGELINQKGELDRLIQDENELNEQISALQDELSASKSAIAVSEASLSKLENAIKERTETVAARNENSTSHSSAVMKKALCNIKHLEACKEDRVDEPDNLNKFKNN